MKKYMNGKKEDTIEILTTFLVFSAIIDPRVSAVMVIGILSCIGIWKISNN